MSFVGVLSGVAGRAFDVGLVDPVMRVMGYLSNGFCPTMYPDAMALHAAWRAGKINDREYAFVGGSLGVRLPLDFQGQEMWQHLGGTEISGSREAWDGVYQLQVSMPTAGDLLRMRLQDTVTQAQFTDSMKVLGYWREDVRDWLVHLSENTIPDPSDLVRFAIREAWDPNTVARFQYDAEFPPEFSYWMKRQGLAGDARLKEGNNVLGPPTNWAQLYWRVHWANVSPTQAYEMYQRLRPDRIARLGPDFQNMRPFTFSDLTQTLKINDYPVPYRAQLAAIAFRKPRLVDIDRFYTQGFVNSEEVYQLHLDLGYSPADARLRTDWLVSRKLQAPADPSQKRLRKAIIDLYCHGQITRDQASWRMFTLINGPRDEFDENAIGAFRQALPHRQIFQLIDAELDLCDLANATRRAKLLLRAFRTQYLRGQINAQEAERSMSAAGFKLNYIRDSIAEWNAILASGKLLMSTARVQNLVKRGIMPLLAGKKYLENLGWKGREIEYLIYQMQADLNLERERIAEHAARSDRQAEKAQLAQLRLIERARQDATRRLNRQANHATLKRYYVRGIIGELEFAQELRRRAIEEAALKRIIDDARIDRQKWVDKYGPGRSRANPDGPARPSPTQAPAQTPVDRGALPFPTGPIGPGP